MPERSRMYFFILETTTRISSSTPLASSMLGAAAPGAAEEDATALPPLVSTKRRTGAPAAGDGGGDGALGEPELEGGALDDAGGAAAGGAPDELSEEPPGRTIDAEDDAEGEKCPPPGELVEDAAGRTIGPGDGGLEEAAGADGLALAASLACSSCQACLVGLRASTAQASRWRASATWLSQQETEQKTRRVRLRLQVETLQTQWIVENPSSLRHALHFSQNSLMRLPG